MLSGVGGGIGLRTRRSGVRIFSGRAIPLLWPFRVEGLSVFRIQSYVVCGAVRKRIGRPGKSGQNHVPTPMFGSIRTIQVSAPQKRALVPAFLSVPNRSSERV